MGRITAERLVGLTLAALVFASAPVGAVQSGGGGVLRAGTIIQAKMDNALTSEASITGDQFSATVTAPVTVGGAVVVPVGTVIEGHVTDSQRARRPSRSGTVAVAFDRLVFADGTELPIAGGLTSTDATERKRLEDDEGEIRGGSSTKRNVIFIGGGAGAGAGIGAIAGNTGLGAGIGAGVGAAAVLLAKGKDAFVPAGFGIGVEILRDVRFDGSTQPTNAPDAGESPDPGSSPEPVQPTSADPQTLLTKIGDMRALLDTQLGVQALRSGELEFSGNNYSQDEVELYVTLGTLESALTQYSSARLALNDDPALKGAAVVVVRSARQFDRVVRKSTSARVRETANAWHDLRPEFARLAQSLNLSLEREEN